MSWEDIADSVALLKTPWPCTHYGVKRYHTCPLCGGHIDIDSDAIEKTWRHEYALELVLRELDEAHEALARLKEAVE